MSEPVTFTIDEDTQGQRLDKALAQLCPDISRSRLKSLIQDNHVTVNGNSDINPSLKLAVGDEIHVEIPDAVDADPQAENIPLDIIYEDQDIIVINKQAGLTVHPGAGQHDGTLVNALLYHCGSDLSGIGGVKRPGIVHRLDKETSGAIIVAKNDKAHQGLSDQLADRSLSRVYKAFVWHVPMPVKGFVDEPIGRHATNRLKMAIRKTSGREAKTHYHVQQTYYDCMALVECTLESGRTHQIRVHMHHIKHPLIGDPLYGMAKEQSRALLNKHGVGNQDIILDFPRQALHAETIGFIHPVSGADMTFEASWPEDMAKLHAVLSDG